MVLADSAAAKSTASHSASSAITRDRTGPRILTRPCFPALFRTNTVTVEKLWRSAEGVTWISRYRSVSVAAELVTLPIARPRG